MDRPTTQIATPGGNKAVIKTYLTARESNQLKEVLYANLNMSMTDLSSGKTEVQSIPASVLLDQERKALELLIVSLNDSPEGVMDRLLDLPSDEYDAIVAEVNKIANPGFQKEK